METTKNPLPKYNNSSPTEHELQTEYTSLANLANIVIGGAIVQKNSDIEMFGKPKMSDKEYVQNFIEEIDEEMKVEGSYSPRAKEFVMGVYDPIGKVIESRSKNAKKQTPGDNVSFMLAVPENIYVKEK